MEKHLAFPKEKIRILLLEGIHPVALEKLEENGYAAELKKQALSEDELAEVIPSIHLLGIRSKTQVTEKVLSRAKNLLAVGCFCIGTDQVDLDAAARAGVAVFNAPFSNTRSVAELTMAEIVMLTRKASHKSMLLHQGVWDKSADGCNEVRNKTLGIIGYGHIGPQIGLLAESFGMRVIFYDILPKLPLGTATQVSTLAEVLKNADFVTLHVPETPETKGMIGAAELALMKKGSHLLNLSRGTVVDIPALAESLRSKHLGGAALDVFPSEPLSNSHPFESELCGLENVILTPHIGGSTFEAQRNIAIEVIASLVKFTDTGSTTGSVNFPPVELPIVRNAHRIMNIHRNVPGVLSNINRIIAEKGVNIRSQFLSTQRDIGYLIMDVEQGLSQGIKQDFDALETSIRTRLLF